MREAEESLRRHRSLATALPSGALLSRVAKSISQAERAWAMTKNRRDKIMSKQINLYRVLFVGRQTLDHRYELRVRDRDRASRWLRAVERVGFRVMHGFASATAVYDVAQDDDGRPLIVLYVGDYDPSGMFMSEHDLPERLERYDGGHVELRRIALKREQTEDLLSFPASDKKKDKRYGWFVRNFGVWCWELDAMDPNDLRALR